MNQEEKGRRELADLQIALLISVCQRCPYSSKFPTLFLSCPCPSPHPLSPPPSLYSLLSILPFSPFFLPSCSSLLISPHFHFPVSVFLLSSSSIPSPPPPPTTVFLTEDPTNTDGLSSPSLPLDLEDVQGEEEECIFLLMESLRATIEGLCSH